MQLIRENFDAWMGMGTKKQSILLKYSHLQKNWIKKKVASNVFAIATVAYVRSTWILLEAIFNSSPKLNEEFEG